MEKNLIAIKYSKNTKEIIKHLVFIFQFSISFYFFSNLFKMTKKFDYFH